ESGWAVVPATTLGSTEGGRMQWAGEMSFPDRGLVVGAVRSCGNPAWWLAAGFPTGVGRSGRGRVVARSFPYPVRFHSPGGRKVRLRAPGCAARWVEERLPN